MQQIRSHESVWQEFLEIIKDRVPLMTYNTWFMPIKPISLDNNRLTIQLHDPFLYEYLEDKYNRVINRSLTEVLGAGAKLVYEYSDSLNKNTQTKEEENKSVEEPKNGNGSTSNKILLELPEVKQTSFDDTGLDPRYTFDTFIKGAGNQLARAAAIAISENPGNTSFNPLFIYGGVGLGKTHLIHAVGNAIYANHKSKSVLYTSSDRFTSEFVENIQNRKVAEFSSKYRNLDVLIIDDIQFLTGKPGTIELFFNIFNSLYHDGKQIILTSDRPAKELKDLDERLTSRFSWGLPVDIQPPDFETRMAILHKKAERYNLQLTNEMIEYMASHVKSNVRELEGCLLKILAQMTLTNVDLSIDLVKMCVKDISSTRIVNISVDSITKIVCDFLGVDEKKIRDKTRKSDIARARQICMYLTKSMTKLTLKMIGLHFGGRDHSTVLHACTEIEKEIASSQKTKELIDDIKRRIELTCT